MIAKDLFLAKDPYRIGAQILRDHEKSLERDPEIPQRGIRWRATQSESRPRISRKPRKPRKPRKTETTNDKHQTTIKNNATTKKRPDNGKTPTIRQGKPRVTASRADEGENHGPFLITSFSTTAEVPPGHLCVNICRSSRLSSFTLRQCRSRGVWANAVDGGSVPPFLGARVELPVGHRRCQQEVSD
jgi:hypothetical protein